MPHYTHVATRFARRVALGLINQVTGEERPQGANLLGGYYLSWPGLLAEVDAGPVITEDQALGLPGIGRGVKLICGVVASLTPHAVRHATEVNVPTKVLNPSRLLTDPDPSWHGPVAWKTAAVHDLIMHGNAFGDATADTDWLGHPQALPLIRADRVSWERSSTRPGQSVYVVLGENGTRTEIAAGDMWHAVVGARSGRRLGRGILATYQRELSIMRAVEQATWVVMKDGRPTGILSIDSDMITAEELKAHKTAFMSALRESSIPALVKADFKSVGWDANSLALVPAREFNMRLASDITGIPPYLLGVPSESRVYSNMESEWANFLKVTVNTYTLALQEALTRCYPRGTSVYYDTDELRRPELKTRWETWAIAVGINAMSIDEVRAEERLKPRAAQPPSPAEEEAQ